MEEREICIALIDNDTLRPADAIILLEGDQHNRLAKCAELFHAGYAPVICFSGNVTNYGYGSYPFETFFDLLPALNLTRDNFIHEDRSTQTREQAEEVLAMAAQKGWKRLILVASHYHQYRAYLTFLQVIRERQSDIILMNAPARELSWFGQNEWGVRIELLQSEFEKIELYKANNHIASYADAIAYQQWKEQALSTY